MRPKQKRLHHDKTAGVNHPFRTKDRHHQRDNQVARITVHRRRVFKRIEFEQVLKQPAQNNQHHMEKHRQHDGKLQPFNNLRRIVHLKSVNHDGRADQIKCDNRERVAVFRFQQPGLHQGHTHQNNQRQLGNFSGKQERSFHNKKSGKNVDFTLLPLGMPNSDGLNIQGHLKFSTTDRLRWLHRLHHP